MMISNEQRDTLASKLLDRNLVSTRDEALALAEKFLEMDVRKQEDVDAETRAEAEAHVIGSAIESAPNAQAAYEQVLYYERIALEPSGRQVFSNARVAEETPQPAQSANNEALQRLHKTEVDLTQMFNVDNMKKAQTS